MALIITNLNQAAEILNQNGIIGLPTETVYGLAGNIYSETAISSIFEMKKRPLFNPLIVHLKSVSELPKVAINIPDVALKLAEKFWPGPLTMVLKKHHTVPNLITAAKDTVAVRVPNHPVALALLNQINFPLAAPSANPFGCISPTNAQHVANYFKNNLSAVLDGGICERGIESTIVGFKDNEVILYRLGAISAEEIEKITGKLKVFTKTENLPEAPGMLLKHYAPVTNAILATDVKAEIAKNKGKKIGLLLFKTNVLDTTVFKQEILAKSGDLKVAAKNLYAALHRLDKYKLDLIIIEKLPEHGLGNSINDRLERATTR
jgi:L-threonylcarbamoyladenylate synthase